MLQKNGCAILITLENRDEGEGPSKGCRVADCKGWTIWRPEFWRNLTDSVNEAFCLLIDGETKVPELHKAIGIDKEILWLDVPARKIFDPLTV